MADDDYVEVNAPVGIDDILITINGDKPFDFKLPVGQGTMYVVLSGSGSWRPLVFGPPMSVIELTRHVQAVVVSKSQAQAIGKRIHKPIS
ncbi:hypothetical protein B0E47_09155 [Rhodanobacter sp. B05]|nr:hypothetical protein B0E47_09155 [Rhodanobacter sp. B05]